ncbi:MAG: AAA family ATPase [Desulfarculaceae bacterium]|nr:AAA family ATPase [Desulfarculaceae bacterium]MCF8072201.1 AAA family ATPase [Desulfarculaceae bacterium]MCF8100122.1 AAA family ATPase [Desulfarculaceae bacterium]MCF8117229.1 AAA family ATPase [Desulfarculaceae bacterium]
MPSAFLSPLDPADLRRVFDPAEVPFDISDNAPDCLESVLGQARAKEALEFGLTMPDMDFHVYVAGPQRTGKTHLVTTFLNKLAADQPPPPDWVYVHNFADPDEPKALSLPPGGGKRLASQMKELVANLKITIPEIFEGEDYARRKEGMTGEFKRKRSDIFAQLDSEAREEGYVLKFEPTGIMASPMGEDGEPLPESAIRDMSDEEREKLRARSDVIQSKVTEALRAVGALEKELQEALSKMDQEMVLNAVGYLLKELRDDYQDNQAVLNYLEALQHDLITTYERFKKKEQPSLPFPVPSEEPNFREYEVNVFVDNSETKGAPVVVEHNPTYPNLFGRIERQAQFGALLTDFTLLKPGAIHQANGGYLVLPALDLLRYWLPWEGLKRALRDRQVKMEDVMEQLGYMITRTLRPQPIPLDLKVVLVGDSQLYHLLYVHDQVFPKLFKVRAQMSEHMEWDSEEVSGFISHLCQIAHKKELLPLHRGAVARLIERAAEMAGDRERLTLRLADLEDLLKESNYHAHKAGSDKLRGQDVDSAIAARRRRGSMMQERLQEAVTRGFIKVASDGEALGQVNGLAVYDLGDYAFGKPSRISASVGLGKDGVTNIDREADLSGPFHNKGVLIIAGFLRERFARFGPLTLTASLVFEQSYGMIDGDSASLAEVLALMSQLANVPLRQDLAITGSMDQHGAAQAIGGVNLKVEGFFRLCEERGLTGQQGVVIPASNLKNLMLHPDVVAAASEGKFAVYTVETVDQAMELFTGMPAGERGEDGKFPEGTLNHLAEAELERMRQVVKDLSGKDKD